MLKQPPGGELPPSPPDPGVASLLNFKETVRGKSSDKHGNGGLDEWVKRLTKIAERPWKVKDDDSLRPMVPARKSLTSPSSIWRRLRDLDMSRGELRTSTRLWPRPRQLR